VDDAAARELLTRLGAFLDQFAGGFGRRAQRTYASRYVQGLLNDSERKSMQPMHGRLSDAGSYQGLQNFITHSRWDVRPFWRRLRATIPVRRGILAVDDTAFPKQGNHSVAVSHQYCGTLGKQANCQVAVSTALIGAGLTWLTSLELYLPQIWAEDPERRDAAQVPSTLYFREKWRIALAHVRQAIAAGLQIEAVVADAAYGEVGKFRSGLERLGLRYVLAVPWHLSARVTASGASESLGAIAKALPASAWQRIRWANGSKGPLEARFVALRVRPRSARAERWLLCQESLTDGERKYYFSNLPPDTPLRTLAEIARSRWAIEVQYRDLKSELGLTHFEGRSYPGWNHHAILAAMTFTFLQLERLRKTTTLPTFPQVRNLVRELMATLFMLERPSWLNLLVSFQRNPPLRI
jgi:SRSO17 transposase